MKNLGNREKRESIGEHAQHIGTTSQVFDAEGDAEGVKQSRTSITYLTFIL